MTNQQLSLLYDPKRAISGLLEYFAAEKLQNFGTLCKISSHQRAAYYEHNTDRVGSDNR